MDLKRGNIVVSCAGHDKGNLYCVVGTDGPFLLLADGKTRKVDHPKRKRRKHAQRAGESRHPAVMCFCGGQPPADRELRRALAAFRDELSSVQGGNTLGKERYD